MRKRSVFACFALVVSLTACATVSVVPGNATVSTSVTQEQSELRAASLAFNETAVSRGWVSEGRGMLDIARVLVEGAPSQDTDQRSTYADLIGVGVRSEAELAATIIADARDAAAALSKVSGVAAALLDSAPDADTIRADLVSFERVLIQAQQTRRVFLDVLTAADIVVAGDIETAVNGLEVQIDQARTLADRLATEYAGREATSAIS